MKFKTFRRLVIAGAGLTVGAGVAYFVTREPPPPPPPRQVLSADASPSAAGDLALRPNDLQVLALARKGIAGDKVKDALRGEWKVNLYRDAGQAGVNRLKIDLDHDDKWDEKWTFSGSEVKRQVAPADDENYTLEYLLGDGVWIDPDAKPVADAAPAVQQADPDALRAFDEQILAIAERNISGDKVKDALKGRVKVNLYKDAGHTQVNRLKVDLDRDDKWDEKWDFEWTNGAKKVKRHVAPADDERYSEEYRLENGAWRRK